MLKFTHSVAYLLSALLLSVIITCEGAVVSLPAYNVNINYTSVSGLSAGGYMAVQLHLAHSSIMIGAGVIAGGPYNCAQGSLSKAQTNCMYAVPSGPDLDASIRTTDQRVAAGQIDDTDNLKNDRVYLFSGTNDQTVKSAVMDVLEEYYAHYIGSEGSIQYVNTLPAAHTFPTDFAFTGPCERTVSPYVGYCSYDGAGYLLNQIFDNNLRPASAVLTGQMLEFDQTEFYRNPASISMADTGYVYVPSECAQGANCLLHVALHGCVQAYETVDNAFIENAGYNQWAETNNIIVLYPQTISSAWNPQNPNECWDWWGYNNANNYDTKSGAQIQALRAMIDRITANYAAYLSAPANLQLINTTDSSVSFKWQPVDKAYGYAVYRNALFLTQTAEDELAYTDENLSSGSRYEYTVAAIGSSGFQGPVSASLVAYTTGNPPPITPPTSLSATEISSSIVTIAWQYVNGADRYNVYRNGQQIGTSVTNSYSDTNLSPSTTYSYTVTSTNASGESSQSSPLAITTNSAFQCASYTDNNYDHVINGRAYARLGSVYANGSDDYLGLYNIFVYTTVSETSTDYFVLGLCP